MNEVKITVNLKKGFKTNGIGIGRSLKLNTINLEVLKEYTDNIETEIDAFIESTKKVSLDIKNLIKVSDIFEAHLMIANDPIFAEKVKDYIIEHRVTAAYAIKTITDVYLKTFNNIYNPHLQERKADILDVTNQILAYILKINLQSLNKIDQDTIIIANDLTPSETASLNLNYVKGLILFNSGITSHTAIIAKLNNIPLIINNELSFDDFSNDIATIIDANHNIIYQNPTHDTLSNYNTYLNDQVYFEQLLKQYANQETYTSDHKKINLLLNINSLEDLDHFNNYQIDGIGLFRTEFLFMKGIPSLESQIKTYQTVLNRFKNQRVTVRTFDLGGDKTIKGFENTLEENPFLGVRGIRFALMNESILKVQIRALLIANEHGNLDIMLPMIATLEEFLQTKELFDNIKNDLLNEGHLVKPYRLGIMIEVPIAALNANMLAKHVDFFSIGTNDLIQYLFAADRMNTNLSYLYQSLHPQLLNTIKYVADAANNHHIDVSVCGEMAGDVNAMPFLIGAGINNLSMSASRILIAKEKISKLNFDDTKNLLQKALTFTTEAEVLNLLNE